MQVKYVDSAWTGGRAFVHRIFVHSKSGDRDVDVSWTDLGSGLHIQVNDVYYNLSLIIYNHIQGDQLNMTVFSGALENVTCPSSVLFFF